MFKRIISLARHIVGRIKSKMAEWTMAAGCLFICIGAGIGFANIDKLSWSEWAMATMLIISGAIFGHYSFSLTKRKEDRLKNQESENHRLLNDLLTEFRGLRQELTKGETSNNGESNNNE